MYYLSITVKKTLYLERCTNLKMLLLETSENFGIMNVQIQFIPFYNSQMEETVFEIIVFYFEIR